MAQKKEEKQAQPQEASEAWKKGTFTPGEYIHWMHLLQRMNFITPISTHYFRYTTNFFSTLQAIHNKKQNTSTMSPEEKTAYAYSRAYINDKSINTHIDEKTVQNMTTFCFTNNDSSYLRTDAAYIRHMLTTGNIPAITEETRKQALNAANKREEEIQKEAARKAKREAEIKAATAILNPNLDATPFARPPLQHPPVVRSDSVTGFSPAVHAEEQKKIVAAENEKKITP